MKMLIFHVVMASPILKKFQKKCEKSKIWCYTNQISSTFGSPIQTFFYIYRMRTASRFWNTPNLKFLIKGSVQKNGHKKNKIWAFRKNVKFWIFAKIWCYANQIFSTFSNVIPDFFNIYRKRTASRFWNTPNLKFLIKGGVWKNGHKKATYENSEKMSNFGFLHF